MSLFESLAEPEPVTGFSQNFLAYLSQAILSPDHFLKSFEKYITTTKGTPNTHGATHHTWVYDISIDVINSPNFLQCLVKFKKNIESTGYRSDRNYSSAYYMKPGTYAIITKLPHDCSFNCQRDGCDLRYKSTLESDPSACAIAICI